MQETETTPGNLSGRDRHWVLTGFPSSQLGPGGSQNSEEMAYQGASNSEDSNWGRGFKNLFPAWVPGIRKPELREGCQHDAFQHPGKWSYKVATENLPFPHLAWEPELHREALHFIPAS